MNKRITVTLTEDQARKLRRLLEDDLGYLTEESSRMFVLRTLGKLDKAIQEIVKH